MLIEQVFDGVGKTHNADSGADNDRDQKQDTLFEFPKQAGDRADEPSASLNKFLANHLKKPLDEYS